MLVAGLIYINIAFFPDPLKNGTNFPKQLLKLPTQRPSSLPWGPTPGPIEHLNIFYFYITSTNSLHCFFSAQSTSTAHICWRWAALPFADQTFRFRFKSVRIQRRIQRIIFLIKSEEFYNWDRYVGGKLGQITRSTNKQERWQVRTHFKRPCFAGALVTNSVAAFRGSGTSEGIYGYVSPFGIPWDLCALLFPWP